MHIRGGEKEADYHQGSQPDIKKTYHYHFKS